MFERSSHIQHNTRIQHRRRHLQTTAPFGRWSYWREKQSSSVGSGPLPPSRSQTIEMEWEDDQTRENVVPPRRHYVTTEEKIPWYAEK